MPAARWLSPSAVAAAGGAVIAGVLEGREMESSLGLVAAAGFVALLAVPLLFAASITVRGVWAAWRPRELGLVEADGSAPRLLGWLGVVGIGAALVAWIVFQGTWQLATSTTFKPLPVSYGEPVFAVGAALVVVAMSRPAAGAFAAIARAIDRRWQRTGRRTLLSPRRILVALVVVLAGGGYAFWRFIVLPKLGTFELGFAVPAIAGGLVAIALHVAWNRLGRARRYVGPCLGGLAAIALGCALIVTHARPSLTLAIWGDRPLAGFTVDKLFDLDAIRARISLAEWKPVAKPDAPHPDIILVTIDTVRADHTPPYGGSADMPTLKEMGLRGTVFEWAFSPSNVTRRSIPSMVIGLGPERVRGRVVGWALRVDPRHVFLPERLVAGGYETAGFMCCAGFWGGPLHTGLDRGLQHLETEPNGLALAKRARSWLDAREQRGDHKPLFLWMHLLEPHNWAGNGNDVPQNERQKLYDRTLAQSDEALSVLLAAFAHRDPGHGPIVIVSADHGEGLGEHGAPFHSTDLYNSQTHVPLVIDGPGIKALRVPETVSLVDLTPTVLDLAGFVPPTGSSIDGPSFADLATGARAGDPEGGVAYSAMIRDRSNPGGIADVIRGRWKLIANGRSHELYDTRGDPNERTNALAAHRDIVQTLERMLADHRAHAEQSPFE